MIYSDDYREIMRDLIAQKPRGEIAKIASRLDVAATLVSQVLAGKRHLTLSQAMSVANHFELDPLEKDYFIGAVHKSRSHEEDLQNYWDEKLKEIKKTLQSVKNKTKIKYELNENAKVKFYSSYLYSGIRLFCSIEKGKTLSEICDKFKISRQRAKAIVDFLLEQRLINEKNGVYQMVVQGTYIPPDSDHIYRHHTNWRLKALSHLSDVKEDELSYTSPLTLDKKTFDSIRADILILVEKAIQKTFTAPAEQLVCLNVDFFRIDS